MLRLRLVAGRRRLEAKNQSASFGKRLICSTQARFINLFKVRSVISRQFGGGDAHLRTTPLFQYLQSGMDRDADLKKKQTNSPAATRQCRAALKDPDSVFLIHLTKRTKYKHQPIREQSSVWKQSRAQESRIW